MEILPCFSIYQTEYIVLKSFTARPASEKSRVLHDGERIRFDDKTSAADIIGYCRLGRVVACIPDIQRYKARRDFNVIIGGKLESVKRFEIIEMAGPDAWPRLLSGKIVPVDELAWSPDRLNPKEPQKRKFR